MIDFSKMSFVLESPDVLFFKYSKRTLLNELFSKLLMFITLTDIQYLHGAWHIIIIKANFKNTIDIIIVNYSNDIHDHIHEISWKLLNKWKFMDIFPRIRALFNFTNKFHISFINI